MLPIRQKHCVDCFRTLSDETRIRIIRELTKEPSNVTRLTEFVGVSQPTISYHLRLLDELGLIAKERKGREVIYSFNKDYPCKGCGVFSIPIKI